MSWALASLAVFGGLQLSTRLLRRLAPAWVLDIHRFLGGLAVVFLGVHLLGLAAAQFIGFAPADFLVPFASPYKPAAVALGALAMRELSLPRRTWHTVHLSSFVIFVTATVHGMNAGADRHHWSASGPASSLRESSSS